MTNLNDLVDRNISGISFDLCPLNDELIAYGEGDVAEWLINIDADTHARVSETAQEVLVAENCTIDKAICLAAVAVCEGAPRPLKRKRRVFPRKS